MIVYGQNGTLALKHVEMVLELASREEQQIMEGKIVKVPQLPIAITEDVLIQVLLFQILNSIQVEGLGRSAAI